MFRFSAEFGICTELVQVKIKLLNTQNNTDLCFGKLGNQNILKEIKIIFQLSKTF